MSDLNFQPTGLGDKPALLLVDMINGFTDPACELGSSSDDVVAANIELLAVFRRLNMPVFFTTVVFHNATQARVFRSRVPALEVLTPESDWVKVDARLERRDNEPLIEKQWASAFFGTDLHQQLQSAQVDSLVVTGLTTSGCVRASAVDGLQSDYRVVVARDAVGDRNQQAHAANLFDLNAKYADVEDNATIIAKLESIATV